MKIEIDTREAEEKFRAFAKMANALVVVLEAKVDALLAKIDIAKEAVGSLPETTRENWSPASWFVIDVESIGLHGEGFQVAWVVVDASTDTIISEGMLHSPPEMAEGREDDRAWVAANVPPPRASSIHCEFASILREKFWREWERQRERGAVMAADFTWPVEARFLIACVQDDHRAREWQGPFPLIDIGSVLAAKGMDPLADHERIEGEPKHCPLGDARQSARLLMEALA